MTQEAKYRDADRLPVVHAGKKLVGLKVRRTSDGEIKFDARTKRNGRVVRKTLRASTASDAIRERRAWIATLETMAISFSGLLRRAPHNRMRRVNSSLAMTTGPQLKLGEALHTA